MTRSAAGRAHAQPGRICSLPGGAEGSWRAHSVSHCPGREGCARGVCPGADDYVTKPFSWRCCWPKPRRLSAGREGRGDTRLQGDHPGAGPPGLHGGRPSGPPQTSTEPLLCLMRNKGCGAPPGAASGQGVGHRLRGGDRAVDGRIKALRAALGPAGKQIRTVFKVGYKLRGSSMGRIDPVVQRTIPLFSALWLGMMLGNCCGSMPRAERTHGGIYAVVPVVSGYQYSEIWNGSGGGDKKPVILTCG